MFNQKNMHFLGSHREANAANPIVMPQSSKIYFSSPQMAKSDLAHWGLSLVFTTSHIRFSAKTQIWYIFRFWGL